MDYTSINRKSKSYDPKPLFYKYNFKSTLATYNSLDETNRMSRDYGDSQRYFTVNFSDIEDYAVHYTFVGPSLAVGVINFPFKLRPFNTSKDFAGAFNFGAGVGLKFGHNKTRKLAHSLISGYSISNIVLDNTSVRRNGASLEKTNNFTALSISLGYLIDYERVQAGIFIGTDMLNRINQQQFGWNYQGVPWVSVGFGFAIFSQEKEKENNPKVSQ